MKLSWERMPVVGFVPFAFNWYETDMPFKERVVYATKFLTCQAAWGIGLGSIYLASEAIYKTL